MNFEFSEDQMFLKEQANKFLSEKCDTTVNRKVLESDAPYDKDLWAAIVEMGWAGTAIPEEYGGLGLGHLELCVIAEELGRAVAPVPFASTVYLAAEALMVAGSEAQKQSYLPDIAIGTRIGTFALSEGAGQPTPKTLKTSFAKGKLNGTKVPVPDADTADFAIVATKTSAAVTQDAVALVIVDLNGPGVTRTSVDTLDPSRSQAQIIFDDAPAEPLGALDEGWSNARNTLDRAAVLMAFEQVGGADVCLEMARDYALERFAFGRQIGSYQALKHKMADMYIKNVLARSNCYYGAWALSTDAPELALAASTARVGATQAYHFASKENIQIHGGMGFTWEVDCHLYYRRSKALGLALGSERVWKDRLVGQLEQRNVA